MRYGYARVSTKGQARNGNSLEEQRERLLEEGCDEVIEEQYTGTTTKRPELQKLLEGLKPKDTLMVTKLDRLSRTARGGSQLIHDLMSRGVKVHILNMGLIEDTSMGRMIANILLAFAEFERDMIVERTQAGKSIARSRAGYREGRPPISAARKDTAVKLIAEGNSYNAVEKMTGLSKSTIVRAVRAARCNEG